MKIMNASMFGIVTKSGKIHKNFVDTVLWMEDGKKFPYREQEVLSDFTGEKRTEIMPKSSRKIVYLLNHLEIEPVCLAEDQKPNRKTKILTINLNKKQQAKLAEYKELCK